jgi:hypothetical protein
MDSNIKWWVEANLTILCLPMEKRMMILGISFNRKELNEAEMCSERIFGSEHWNHT